MNTFAEYLTENAGPLAVQFNSKTESVRVTSAAGVSFTATGLAESWDLFTAASGALRKLWHEDVAAANVDHRKFLTALGWPRIYDARAVDRALAPEYKKPAPAGGQALAALLEAHSAAPAVHREHATALEYEASIWHDRNEAGYRVDETYLTRARQSRHRELAALARLIGTDIRDSETSRAKFLDSIGVVYTKTNERGWTEPRLCDASAVTAENADVWAAYVAGYSTLKRVQILDGYHRKLGIDGRLRPVTQANAARSGRVAMSGVALTNLMKELRAVILTENPRGSIIGVDHTNAEMKVLAWYINSPRFTEQVNTSDLYQLLADLTGQTRSVAKRALISFTYNQRIPGLAKLVGMDTAKKLHAGIDELFPEIGPWREAMAAKAKRGEPLVTLYGRPLPKLTGGPDDGFGKAGNLLVQGGARDAFSIAVRRAEARGLEMFMPLHDELFIECGPGEVETATAALLEVMTVDIGRGLTLSGTASTSRGRWAQP